MESYYAGYILDPCRSPVHLGKRGSLITTVAPWISIGSLVRAAADYGLPGRIRRERERERERDDFTPHGGIARGFGLIAHP